MPEDDVHLALAQLSTNSDMMCLYHHLESIHTYTKHHMSRVDEQLSVVRAALHGNGIGEAWGQENSSYRRRGCGLELQTRC